MLKLNSFVVLSLLLMTRSGFAEPVCDMLHATYITTVPGVKAKFLLVPRTKGMLTPIAFRVITRSGNHSFDFIFDEGSSGFRLVSTENVKSRNWFPPVGDAGLRPLGDMPVFFFDKLMKPVYVTPSRKSKAPAYIFAPDLSDRIYSFELTRNPTKVPLAIFRLSGCSPAVHKEGTTDK